MYILKRAFSRLWCHKITYITITIELIVSVCLLTLGINSAVSTNNALDSIRKELRESVIYVRPFSIKNSIGWELFSINHNDYVAISEKYEDILEIGYANYVWLTFIDLTKGEFWEPTLCFMDDNMFYDLFGVERKPGGIYTSEENINKLNEYSQLSDDEYLIASGSAGQFGIKDNQFFVDETGYTPLLLQNKNDTEEIALYGTALSETDIIKVDKLIIFPAEMSELFNATQDNNGVSTMTLQILADDFEADTIADVLDILARNHSGIYTHQVSDSVLDAEKIIHDQTFEIRRLTVVSVFLLAIIVLGITGILFIFLNKRKKSIAVSIAVGATFNTVALELVTEVFTASFIGCMTGVAAAYFLTPYMTGTLYFEITFHMQSILYGLLITVFITAVTCFLALVNIKDFRPVKILCEL